MIEKGGGQGCLEHTECIRNPLTPPAKHAIMSNTAKGEGLAGL